MFNKEKHQNLHGGTGIVTTYTRKIYFFRRRSIGRFIILVLEPKSSIGLHQHLGDSEIYVTFNRNIRFCENKKWRFLNYCKKGNMHCAENISNKKAKIFAFKF